MASVCILVYLSRIPAHRKLKWCRQLVGFSDGHETYVQFLSDQHPEKSRDSPPDDFVYFLSFSDETRISGILLWLSSINKE
jgi:hypothetical protein